MSVDWAALRKELVPIRDYADLSRRWREAFDYPFVSRTYNFTMPKVAAYTQRLLGEDTRGRYSEYVQKLAGTFDQLQKAGVRDILDLVRQNDTSGQFEHFSVRTGVNAKDLITVLKYLVYWFIPSTKLLSSLVETDSPLKNSVQVLRDMGIRTNLDILQQGLTSAGRKSLAKNSGLPQRQIDELVNRADFSRLPWASKATISNIIGAGCVSLSQLAVADPEQLYRNFFRYGTSIEKNLKLGNEIDNSHRIAKLIPPVLK